jgi:hypothetical protein
MNQTPIINPLLLAMGGQYCLANPAMGLAGVPTFANVEKSCINTAFLHLPTPSFLSPSP